MTYKVLGLTAGDGAPTANDYIHFGAAIRGTELPMQGAAMHVTLCYVHGGLRPRVAFQAFGVKSLCAVLHRYAGCTGVSNLEQLKCYNLIIGSESTISSDYTITWLWSVPNYRGLGVTIEDGAPKSEGMSVPYISVSDISANGC